MSERKFKSGDKVLIEKKHLHGIAAVVQGYTSDSGDEVVARISEQGFEGHLVSFPESDLVAIDDPAVEKQHEENLEKNPDAEEVLDVHPTSRLPWNYRD